MNFFHCRSAVSTVQGRRPTNQDAVLDVRLPNGRHLVAVADGMGGHNSGEVASALALECLESELRAGSSLRDAMAAANRAVYDAARRDPTRAGMGTTLVALLRTEAVYQIANVGDSRAYRIDRHGIRRISRDHSFAEEAVHNALMAPDEIARSPWRNALTRSIGTQESVEVDLFGPFEIAGRPHNVMLCSDGLYRGLSDEAAWHHLISAPDPNTAARSLIDLSLRHGSDDNVSVAVVQFEGIPASMQTRGQAPPQGRPSGSTGAAPRTGNRSGGSQTATARPYTARVTRPMQVPVQNQAFALRRKRSPLRRSLDVILNDNVLFGVTTGILMMWLAFRLLNG